MLPEPGDTYRIRLDQSEPVEHLWVVLTSPNDEGKVVAGPICTKRDHSDTTLVLDQDDHPFIKWKSVVAYDDLGVYSAQQFVTATVAGAAIPHAPFDEDLLSRMRDGIKESDRVPPALKTTAVAMF